MATVESVLFVLANVGYSFLLLTSASEQYYKKPTVEIVCSVMGVYKAFEENQVNIMQTICVLGHCACRSSYFKETSVTYWLSKSVLLPTLIEFMLI